MSRRQWVKLHCFISIFREQPWQWVHCMMLLLLHFTGSHCYFNFHDVLYLVICTYCFAFVFIMAVYVITIIIILCIISMLQSTQSEDVLYDDKKAAISLIETVKYQLTILSSWMSTRIAVRWMRMKPSLGESMNEVPTIFFCFTQNNPEHTTTKERFI